MKNFLSNSLFKGSVIVSLALIFILGFGLGNFWHDIQGSKVAVSSSTSPNLKSFFETKLAERKLDPELFWQVWDIVKTNYVKQPVSDADLFYGSLRGVVSALKDPYSVFLDPETSQKFKTEMTGTFEGIGVEIGIKKNQLTVIAPLPNTPGAKAGLKAGDIIEAIDKQETVDMSADYAASLIRGKRGTKVTLTVFRQGWDKVRDFSIVRAKIVVKTIEWKMQNKDIAYLKISHFNNDTYNDLSKAVKGILANHAQKLILDLRNNPGGYLDVAVDSAGFWLPNQKITYSKDAKGEVKNFTAQGQGELSNLKTVVLVNRGSASAAEILAGALQDYQKATLVGEKTFGKGSVQELLDLAGGSSIKVTTAYWYTPKDRQINEIGIEPDIKADLTDKDYNEDKDPQLDKAVELLK